MAKKISNESFIEKDFLKPAIESVKEFIKQIEALKKTMSDVGAESKKTLEGLNPNQQIQDVKKLNETLEKLIELEKDLEKIDDEKAKSLKTLKSLQDQKIKQDKAEADLLIKSNKAKQEEQKIIIQEKKAEEQNLKLQIAKRKERERQFALLAKERAQKQKQLSEYQKESARLNELRNKYKDLAVANQENTKEAKELLSEITKLDKRLKEIDNSVGQNTRSVGKYENALNGLNSGLAKLGVVALVTKGIELLTGAFGDTREGALEFNVLFSKITETVKVFVNNIIKAGPAVVGVFSAMGDSFKSVGVRAELAFKKIDRAISFKPDTVKKLDSEIKTLEGTLAELEKSSVAEQISKIGKAFEGTIDTTSRAIIEQEKFLRLQLQLKIQIEQQERALAGLAEKRQILQDISDDDTLGFVTRTEAVKKAQIEAEKFAELELKLAKTKEKLTIEAVKQDLRRANALSETQLQAIQTGEQLQNILKNENLAKKISDENDSAFTQAFIERRNKVVEAESFRRDQEEKNRKTARDAFEQDLDILEEFTEKRVAENEKIINSDTASLEQRQKALRENQKLEKELFEESIRRIFVQGKASIDLRKDLTDAEKEQKKALIDTADIQKILNTQDEQERLALIRKIDLGEIEEKRLKESLKIKQDIAIVNAESLKIEEETIRKTESLKNEILLQEQKIKDETFDLEKAKTENTKKELQARIDLLKKDSIERLELEKELNDLILTEQEEANEKSEEETKNKREKEQEAREKLVEEGEEFITEQIEKANEKRLSNIDSQIEAIQERQDSLRTLAENGNEEAVKSLADSQKREAELRRQKENELRRQKLIEIGTAAFSILASKSKQDPKTALPETLKEVLSLSTFVNSLPQFFEGTENIGESMGKPHLNTSRDGYLALVGGSLARLDGGERVLTSKQNKLIGDYTNEDLTRLAVESRKPTINTANFMNTKNIELLLARNNEILKKLPSMMPTNHDTFDEKVGVLTSVARYSNKVERTHQRLFIPKRKI